jgi:3',5'-cyclic AMP phosphodiesterase CpdA
MTDTITLAQLSDVHLAPLRGLALRHLNVKRGLGYLNWQRGRRHVHRRDALDLVVADLKAQRPDHIAVTGDLINLGLPAEFEAARAWLEGLGRPDHVTVIPGNHDIYTHLGADPGVECWADYMQSDIQSDAFGAGVPKSNARFPFVRRVGPVALVALNSAVPTPPFVAAGELGDRQIATLGEILDRLKHQSLIRVVLIHHPPLVGQASPRRALRDAAALQDVLSARGAELVLHGHNHRDSHVDFTFAHGHIPVVGLASSSAGRAHKSEPLGRYNLVRIGRLGGAVHIEVTTRGLDASGARVEQIARHRVA